jgi:UDP-N-acetylmuramoyl-L-alanyl-D-glutamate--2,6-diaminopimelate ligase
MKLVDLLSGTGAEMPAAVKSTEINGVTRDSRQVTKRDLFVAVPGEMVDGAQFADEAVARGAVAVVTERPLTLKCPTIQVESARKALAVIAANFYKRPADGLNLLAVTGTNGKTTTACLLESICAAGGASCGVIGTIHSKFAGRVLPSSHTTPDPLEMHRIFREMVEAGVDTVVMEVSSHAMTQDRVFGLTFRAAAFTNLSRDHLDYHKEIEDYFQAKRRLFVENLSAGGVAVVNSDDTYCNRIYTELRGMKRMAWKFSRQPNAEIAAVNAELTHSGIRATLKTPAGDIPVKSSLVGTHNLENILAAAGVALSAGFSRRDVQDGIERMQGVPGRMERIEDREVVALVDYAHTDDALRRVLESVRSFTKGRLIVVFGCGGDRDRGKRPLMGAAAAEGSDVAVITSDNPRSEDPDEIITQITVGIEKAGFKRISQGKARAGEKGYLVEADRGQAITLAANLAKPGDVILIAGKGHETYQLIDGESRPFDDRLQAAEALKARG